MELSMNFSLEELTHSNTAKARGINNTPGEAEIANLKELAMKILQPIREAWGAPITINSGYRCEALNKAVKGAKTSQHVQGAAVDISVSGSKAALFALIYKMMEEGEITVGQLIWEYGTKKEPRWIHVSLPTEKKQNQVLYYYDK